MPTFHTRALSLRRWPRRGTSRVYRFLTIDRGTVEATAAGAAGTSSKMAGHLEPFSEVRLLLARKQGPYRVAGAVAVQRFSSPDLEVTRAMAQLAAVAEQLSGGEYTQGEPFAIVKRGWQQLVENPEQRVAILSQQLVALCAVTGYAIPAALPPPGVQRLRAVEAHLARVLPYPIRLG